MYEDWFVSVLLGYSLMIAKLSDVRSTLQPEMAVPELDIHVGLVMSHALAARQMVELVKLENMHPVLLSVKNAGYFPEGPRVVIIFDLWGLPTPVSEYLNAFSLATPQATFLALDQPSSEVEIAQLLRAGFAGFITHDQALHLLGPAIKAVAVGQVWASPEVLRIYVDLTSPRNNIRATGIATLTVRESQILDLLRRRYSNKEIANHLGISESTVKFHVSNVLTKLNVNDRRDVRDREYLSGANLPLSNMTFGQSPFGLDGHKSSPISVRSENFMKADHIIGADKSKTG